MNRKDLIKGKSTPSFVERALEAFGQNPYNEPNFRLIWSERKQIFFAGEWGKEYLYFERPCWVLERWTDPRKDAGTEAQWHPAMEFLMGPYPRHGTYNCFKAFEPEWNPNEETVQVLVKALQESDDVSAFERQRAIREQLQQEGKEARQEVVAAIREMQDSASEGRIQQAVSGPKNNFRTVDDFQRDYEKTHDELPHMPKRGGKLVN